MRDNSITICSVYYSKLNKDLLELSFKLTKHLNPRNKFSWIVTDNSPKNAGYKLKNKTFKIIPGAKMPPQLRGRASYHHARGIKLSLDKINTRFALFLDCDLFIVKKNWINQIINYMQKHELSFFGVPWHPKWFSKYRYFPCIHFFLVDLERVNIKTLNFLPEIERINEVQSLINKSGKAQLDELDDLEAFSSSKYIPEQYMPRNTLTRLINHIQIIYKIITFSDRKLIGISRDTGYRIYNLYGNSTYKFALAVPVFRIKSDFRGPKYALSKINFFFERLLKDSNCFIPKNNIYYTETTFAQVGFPDTHNLGYEEYFWKGKPFCFHLRSYRNPGKPDQDLENVKSILKWVKKHER